MDDLVIERFFKTGKQGIVGNIKNKADKGLTTFKVSQYINYLSEHEYSILSRLNDLDFCFNFCKPVGLELQNVEIAPKKNTNPFTITSKYPIQKQVLLEEFVRGEKLYKFIKNGTCTTETIISTAKQVLSAIAIAQQKTQFTHYDLHSDNIILKKCDTDKVVLYVLNETTAFAIPTFGYIPVIIDFGFSFIDKLNNNFLTSSLGHTEIGFTSDRFDWVADPKLFLVTLFNELKQTRRTKNVKILENVVRNMFAPLNIDWECGWDSESEISATDALIKYLDKSYPTKSRVFNKHACFSFDLLCSLIVLPLKEQSYSELGISYITFVKEFSKIEDEIKSSQYNLYILKCIIDSARKYMNEYISEPENVVKKFRLDVDSAILKVSKFCSPRKIHYEKMLCSLYNFANCASGMLFHIMKKNQRYKNEEYSKLPITGIIDIINILMTNLDDSYKYNENTVVSVVDAVNNCNKEITLNEELINTLNKSQDGIKGLMLYEFYKNNNDTENNELSDDELLNNENDDEHDNDIIYSQNEELSGDEIFLSDEN